MARFTIQQIKLRLIITSLFVTGIGMVLLPVLATLLIVSFYAVLTVTSTYARNAKRQSDVKQIITRANEFYLRTNRYPHSLDELKQHYSIQSHYTERTDSYPYSYRLTENGQNCIVAGLQTNGKLFVEECKP